MEIALIDHQDVAEPDQSASGVAGTGLRDGGNTGIAEYGMMGNVARRDETGKKNRIVLGLGVLGNGGGIQPPAPAVVLRLGVPGNGGIQPPAPTVVLRLGVLGNGGVQPPVPAVVLRLGVLGNGGVQPPVPGVVPTEWTGAGVVGNNTAEPAAHSPNPAKQSGNPIIPASGRYEGTGDRLDRKIGRLDRRLDKREKLRMQKRDEKGRLP